MPRSSKRSKPPSVKIRSLANSPIVQQENGSNVATKGLRRSARKRARNPVYAEENESESSPPRVSSSDTHEPPKKRPRSVDDDVEGIICTVGTKLYYSKCSAAVWSSFLDKHQVEYWEQCPWIMQGVRDIRRQQVAKWSSKHVADFVTILTGQEQYGQRFFDHEVDGEAFLLLTQEDILDVLQIKLGPTLKIHGAILIATSNP